MNQTLKRARPEYVDPVIEAYKKHVDRTILRHNLQLSIQERVDQMVATLKAIGEFQRAGKVLRNQR